MTGIIMRLAAILLVFAAVTAQAAESVKAAPSIKAFGPDSMAQIIDKQKGKPFVLIIWSLDCEYCHASMRTIAQEIRKGKRLQVVTLSTDPAADPQSAKLMQQRLAALGMRNHAWAYGEAPAEQLRFVIDPKWYGEKPRSYWFNARGERVAYSGIITADTVTRLTAGW